MATPLLLKRSSVSGKTPTTASLALGELALNTYDGRAFFKYNQGSDVLREIVTLDGTQTLSNKTIYNGLVTGTLNFADGSVQPTAYTGPYTKVVSNTNAIVNCGYLANTGAGSFTITLPANPTTGQFVTIADDNAFGTNPLYVARNGNPIVSTAADLTLDITGVSVTLMFDGGSWNVYTQVGATGGSGAGTEGSEYNYSSFPQSLIPDTNNAYTLGNGSYQWNSAYIYNVYGTLTGNVNGNASSSSYASNITVTTNNGTTGYLLFGPTGGTSEPVLNSNYFSVNSSTGTLSATNFSGTWIGSVISPTYGGTGVNNGSKTITLGGNLATSGAYTTTLTATANTSVTLPTTGTLATLAGSETLTNKTIAAASNTITGLTTSNLSSSAAITNGQLANSTISGISLGSNLATLTIGTGLSGTSYNGSTGVTITIDSTVATLTGSQTLTNKTLTSPVISSITNTGTITIPTTTGTLALQGDTYYIGTTAVTLNRASANLALTGISSVTLPGSVSGTVQIIPTSAVGTGTVLTIPATTGTIVTTGDTGTVTNTMLAGSIATSKITGLATSATTDTTNATNITSGTLPNARLSSVPNSALANSSVTVGTTAIALGASSTTLAGLTSVTSTSFVGALTGNASTVTNGVYTTDTGSVTNTMLAGSIANAKLVNSSVTIGSTSVSLGATVTSFAGLTSVTSTSFTGALTGNASTATALQTARAINGVNFDGSAAITVKASTTNALTIGTGLSGISFDGSGAVTIAIDSTVTTLTGSQTLTNKTLTTPTINGAALSGTLSGTPTFSGLVTLNYTGAGSNSTLVLGGYNSKGGTGYHDFLVATNGYGSASNPNKFMRLDSSGNLQVINSAYTSVIFQVGDSGQVSLAQSSSTNNDPTTNWLSFNNNQTAIYDDGNTHIHNRASGQSIWINTNGGDLRLLQQSTVNGGALGNSVIVGGSSSSSATAFLNVLGSKTYTVTSYGYLSTSGAGTGGNTGNVAYGIYNANRMQSAEIDVTSDERAKDIQGTIPLESALKFVKEVDGILYTWKEGKTEAEYDAGLKTGFGAQAVHKAGFDHMIGHIPNPKMEKIVDEDGWVHPEGIQLTMGYNQAIPYHHEVIKHLLERIEKLEAQLKVNNV